MQYEASNGGGDQTDFRQSTELFGGSERERDCGTPLPDYSVCQVEELTEERDKVEQELGILAERLETLIRENARVAQDQTEYLKQENEIRALYVEKQGHLARLDEQIAEREGKRNTLEGMIQVVCGINGEQTAFDEDLWGGLLDHIVVKEDGAIVVIFNGGIEIGVAG